MGNKMFLLVSLINFFVLLHFCFYKTDRELNQILNQICISWHFTSWWSEEKNASKRQSSLTDCEDSWSEAILIWARASKLWSCRGYVPMFPQNFWHILCLAKMRHIWVSCFKICAIFGHLKSLRKESSVIFLNFWPFGWQLIIFYFKLEILKIYISLSLC